MENDENIQAQEALASINSTRAGLADKLVTPWFYYPVLGALMAGMVLVYGLERFGESNLRLFYPVVVVFGCLALVTLYSRMTGVTITAPLGRRSRKIFAVFCTGLVAPLIWLVLGELTQGVVIGMAVGMVVFTVLAGMAYDASLRADLRAGSAPQ